MADILQEVVTFPDWGKMAFTEYAGRKWTEVLPDCDDGVRDLVAGLVQYESTRRTSAKQVCCGSHLIRARRLTVIGPRASLPNHNPLVEWCKIYM